VLNQSGTTPAQIAKWQAEAGAAEAATTKVYFGFTKMLDQIGVQFPDQNSNLGQLEIQYLTGEATWDQLNAYIRNTFVPATARIASDFAAYMARNPARYVD